MRRQSDYDLVAVLAILIGLIVVALALWLKVPLG